jgi:enoyl-CoA hydratase
MSSAVGPSAASEDVLVRRENGVLIVTINRPPMSVRASKAVAIESADWPLAEGFRRQRAYLEPVFASRDAAEGVAAFRERRDPVWQDR